MPAQPMPAYGSPRFTAIPGLMPHKPNESLPGTQSVPRHAYPLALLAAIALAATVWLRPSMAGDLATWATQGGRATLASYLAQWTAGPNSAPDVAPESASGSVGCGVGAPEPGLGQAVSRPFASPFAAQASSPGAPAGRALVQSANLPAGRITGVEPARVARVPGMSPAGQLPGAGSAPNTTLNTLPGASPIGLPSAQPAAAPANAALPECCESAVVLARVGSEVILAADLLAGLDRMIRQNTADKQLDPEELERKRQQTIQEIRRAIHEAQQRVARPNDVVTESTRQRAAMLSQVLNRYIDTRSIYLDAKQRIPAEGFTRVEQQVRQHYDEHEVPKLRAQLGVSSWAELDRALRARGTSLEQDFRVFLEQTLAQQWLRQQAKVDEEITYDQMVGYYQEHLQEFDKPARTRWQELRVSFARHPSKAEAFAAIAAMGNEILDGADFAAVARAGSDGPTAAEGGMRQWPDPARRISPILRQAVEGLPVGQLSPILEDWNGYYIIRVLERKPAGLEPFVEAQSEIREKIRAQRTAEQLEKYKAELRRRFPVWTILDVQSLAGVSSP